MTEKEWMAAEKAKMKPSTLAFAMGQCRKNSERIEREKRGDYGQPIFIVAEREA